MSSTNRGGKRSEADYYPTPAWVVHRFLEEVELSGWRWLEPAAGDGSLVRAVNQVREGVEWHALELWEEMHAAVTSSGVDAAHVLGRDFRKFTTPMRYDVAITNPPFSLACEFIARCHEVARDVVLLLRLNFLGSEDRNELMRSTRPDVYVLPNRVSFTGTGRTDSVEYAWFHWRDRVGPGGGRVRVLKTTSLATRRASNSG